MRDDEIIDVCAPWANSTGRGAHFNMEEDFKMDNDGRQQPQKPAFDDFDDFDVGVRGLDDENNIANNVDDFLNDFLSLSGDNPDGSIVNMDVIPHGDLAWLHEPDAFLPLVATASEDATNSQEEDPHGRGGNRKGSVSLVAGVASVSTQPDVTIASATVVCDASDAGSPVSRVHVPPDLGGGNVFTSPSFGGGDSDGVLSGFQKLRRQKVARYLAKKKRRKWSKASSYQSRQRVANARPRHKGRFLPLESEFVPIAELKRRQRALMIQMQQKMAEKRAEEEEDEEEAVLPREVGDFYASGAGGVFEGCGTTGTGIAI